MDEPELWFVRGEGGAVNAMQLPLHEGIAARLRSGALLRVNADGTPWTGEPAPADPDDDDPDDDQDDDDPGDDEPDGDEPAGETPAPVTLAEQLADKALAEQASRGVPRARPLDTARKAEWVAFAASTGRITENAADELTKAELVQRFGG